MELKGVELSGHGLFVMLPQYLPGWTEKYLEHLRIVFVPDEIRKALLPNMSELLPVELTYSVIPAS
jgi:hypothetical protein